MLDTSGVYSLTVGGNSRGEFGTYTFRIVDAGAPEIYPIAIGDIVAPNMPALGAGRIESAGALDIYLFDAAPAEIVFFMASISPGGHSFNASCGKIAWTPFVPFTI